MNVLAVIKKELIQIVRDVRTLLLLIFVPAFLLVLFGYVLSFDVKNTALAVVDHDRTESSRLLINTFTSGGYFVKVADINSDKEASKLLDVGKAEVAVVIPNGFEKDLQSGENVQLQALLDGSEARVARILDGYISAYVNSFSNRVASDYVLRTYGLSIDMPLELQTRIWYNPELESTLFLVTGLIVFILMITTTISTSLSVVREREHGTMEQLMVSPLNSASVIIGKTVPYLFVAILSTIFILVISNIAFGVEVRGSYLLLSISSFVFILAALSQGIFISTVTTSQQVAFFIAALSTLLPAMLLSGFVFPIASMPVWIQYVTKVLPATYFVTLLRAVLMKGAGFESAWEHLLALMLFSTITIVISAVRLKRMKVV